MHDAHPSNRKITKAMGKVLPELVKRYGGYTNCTGAQLAVTLSDMDIEEEVTPYLQGLCLAPEQLASVQDEGQGVNWEEVLNRSALLMREYKLHRVSSRAHFYESGLGMIAIDHH